MENRRVGIAPFRTHFRVTLVSAALTLVMAVPMWLPAQARTCEDAAPTLTAIARRFAEASDGANVTVLADYTYPALIEMMGGRAAFMEASATALSELKNAGLTLESSTFGAISKTYVDGRRRICFLPQQLVFALRGQRLKSIGFLIAVHDPQAAAPWTFLDSNGLRNNPALLWEFFPGLPKNVQLPPVRRERLP